MKRFILLTLAFSSFVFVSNARPDDPPTRQKSEAYKVAEGYCGQFGKPPTAGTSQNHSVSHTYNTQEKNTNQGTQNHYNIGGGAGGKVYNLVEGYGNIGYNRDGERKDKENSKSSTTTEYYNCK